MSVTFCPIASGSSGNCVLVFSKHTRILFDAGISGKRIELGLKKVGVSPSEIDALFITHDHSDHTKGAGIISRRHDIPVYATLGSWKVMESMIGTVTPFNKRVIYKGEHCVINDVVVTPFEIPHDAPEPVGFNIFVENIKMCIATDIGHTTQTIQSALSGCEVVLLEANHDLDMLKTGAYPYYLKKRILGERGHLSNVAAGNTLLEAISCKLKHIYLGHLSNENNEPALAYATVADILKKHRMPLDRTFNMHVANRHDISEAVEI